MIVLHVARARTDSINIRGSLGKTRAALWITGATFLYFSGCNAHTPFTLFPSPPPVFLVYPCRFCRVTSLSRSFLTRPSSVSVSPFYPRAMLLLHFSFPFTCVVLFSDPFLSFILDPPTIPCPLMESRHSRTVSPFGIVTFSAEMETVPKWKLFPAPTRETELPRNPLIYSIITGHRPSSL